MRRCKLSIQVVIAGWLLGACMSDAIGPSNREQIPPHVEAMQTSDHRGSVSHDGAVSAVGDTTSLQVAVSRRRGQNVARFALLKFQSREPRIASVSSRGFVTALAIGATWIVVTAGDGFRDSVLLHIASPAQTDGDDGANLPDVPPPPAPTPPSDPEPPAPAPPAPTPPAPPLPAPTLPPPPPQDPFPPAPTPPAPTPPPPPQDPSPPAPTPPAPTPPPPPAPPQDPIPPAPTPPTPTPPPPPAPAPTLPAPPPAPPQDPTPPPPSAPAPVPAPTPVPAPAPGQLFADGFESGNLSATQNGVRWTGAPYVDVTTSIAHSGTRSARFRQGAPQGDGTWAELRFGGLPRLTEVYIQFYLYMPNGTENPSVGPRVTVLNPGGNDKFFRIWADDYGAAPKLGASTWSRPGNTGAIGHEYTYSPPNGVPWGMGQGPTAPPLVPFVIDANKGRWIQMRLHFKVSGADNRSGVIQIWADGTLLVNQTQLAVYPPNGVGNYLANGYILGYANSGFQPGQFMYVDDVTFSTGGFPN